jgi:sodium-dependent dicarboxylate transporter 2/3/5
MTSKLLLRIGVGSAAFLLVQFIPMEGLEPRAQLAVGFYGWVLAWWVATPVPWAVTALLPLVLFPLGGVRGFREATALYGQRILPFVLGVMLFGHAFRKHGLGCRLAVRVLRIPGVATSSSRLVLMFLIVTAIVSTLVDDAATVAIMIPIAVSVARFAAGRKSESGAGSSHLGSACCLAVLYGSGAGCLATPAGMPFNPLVISLLDELTVYQVSFAQWTATGLILAVAVIPVYCLVLMWVSAPGADSIADSTSYIESETQKLGPMGRGEKNVVFVLIVMVVLWFLPAFVTIDALDIWYVPSVAMVLLFLLPVDAGKGEMTLNAKDFQDGVLWNVLFLVVGGRLWRAVWPAWAWQPGWGEWLRSPSRLRRCRGWPAL